MYVMNTLIFTFYNNIALNLYHSVSFFTNHNTVNFDYVQEGNSLQYGRNN